MFDELADYGVVEVVNVLPLDSLQYVLLLLRLEGQFDKHLLQLLVAIVDDKLLKTISILKDLEAVYIQNSHHLLLGSCLCLPECKFGGTKMFFLVNKLYVGIL